MRRRSPLLFGLVPGADDRFGIGRVPFRPKHQEFREEQLASAERVVWKFPEVDPYFEFRKYSIREVGETLTHDPRHALAGEVSRIVGIYRDDFLKALEAHEKRYNRGSMPQVTIAREFEPRFGVQHAGMHIFATMFYETVVDATEEDPLLNPKASS